MEELIQNSYPSFQQKFYALKGHEVPHGKPCLFPVNETSTAKRHLTLTKSRTWYDYTAKQEFWTFEDWLNSISPSTTIKDIRYGFNRFDGQQCFVKLDDLLPNGNVESKEDEKLNLAMRNCTINISNSSVVINIRS